MNIRNAVLKLTAAVLLSLSAFAQQGGGGGGGGGGSGIPGPTGTGQCFISTASGAGNWTWGSCSGSSSLAFSSLTTATNTTATMTMGSGSTLNTLSGSIIDFSATQPAQFKLPVLAGATTSANGNIGFDSTAKNWHIWSNGVDNYVLVSPSSGTFNANDCVQIGTAAGVITLVDSGSTCGGGNLSNNGTPVSGQAGIFVDATHIQGVNTTGSGNVVRATTPTLITPILGAATATSINGLAITSSTGTLTIANAKTATISNTLTFTGTDASSVAFGAGGIVAYTANNLSVFASTTSAQLAGVISDEIGSGKAVFATALQGTDANLLTAGTISASTGASLCTDANHGATTTGCASTGNTVSTALTTNFIPVANGANSIIDSLLDDGSTTTSTLSYAGSGGIASTGGGGAAGIAFIGQGTVQGLGTTAIGLTAPASVTSYNITFPPAVGTGVLNCSAASNIDTCAWTTFTSALSSITSASGSNTIANGNNLQAWNWALTAAPEAANTFGETLASTGGTSIGSANQNIVAINTLAGSTANPLSITQGSVTGTTSPPALQILSTYNSATAAGPVVLVNLTAVSLTAGALIEDLRVGGASKWNVDKVGSSTQSGTVTTGAGGSVAGQAALSFGTAGSIPTGAVGVTTGTSGTAYQIVLPTAAGTGNLNCTNSANVDTCAWIAGSSALSGTTAATASNTIASGNNGLQIWNWAPTSNQVSFQLGETSAATGGTLGNQYGLKVVTLAGSTSVPLNVTSSLTGSQTLPTVHITPTWNTTGVVDAALLINATNTASGAGSLLADYQVGGVSQWKEDKAGNTTQLGTATFSGSTGGFFQCTAGSANGHATASTITMECPASVTAYEIVMPNAAATGIPLWTNASSVDTVSLLTSAANGDLLIGSGTTWAKFAGNTSGTKCLTQDSSGNSSWGTCGGAAALSAITAATGSNTIANGNNGLQIWNWAATTNQNQFQFGETTAATSGTLGNQYILSAKTLAGSTAVPFGIIGSLTGSQTLPTLHITPTWNTTGVVDAAVLVNVTNTASGAASLLFDGQIGGVSQWKVDKAGNQTLLGSIALGTSPPACTGGTAAYLCLAEGTAFTNVASTAGIYPDSTAHELVAKTNGASSGGILIRQQPGSIRSTGNTAAITTATLCASSAGACNTAGTYHIHWSFYEGGTACATPGTGGVTFLLTWTDGNGTAHSAVSLPMDDSASLVATSGTFTFRTTLAAAYASGDFNIDTNGSIIQYATGYTACSSGTGNYALSAVATRLQ